MGVRKFFQAIPMEEVPEYFFRPFEYFAIVPGHLLVAISFKPAITLLKWVRLNVQLQLIYFPT